MEWVCCVGAGLVLLLVIGYLATPPGRCTLCSNAIKKKSYTWRIDGKKHHVCPHCNATLERKQSRRATSRL